MRQATRGYADALIALAAPSGEGSLATLAGDLSGVSGVIGVSDDLRRALADPGVPVDARRAVLEQLFNSRVGAATMAAVGFVLRTERAADVPDAVAWMAERITAASRDLTPVGDVVLGTKGAEERAEGFATAILATVDGERSLGNLEDELFRFSRVVAGSEPLLAALTSRDYPPAVRQAVIRDLLTGKAGPATVHLATYAARIGRPRDYQALLDHLVERVAEETNRRLAEVRSAVALDDGQQARLAQALSRHVGHDVDVHVTVDPSVVAGFVAVVGDTVVDASARHQLEALKERLVMPEVTLTTGENA